MDGGIKVQFKQLPINETEFISINDIQPPELVPNGYFTKCDNAVFSDNQISKVFGSSAIANSLGAYSFNGLAPYENAATASKYLVANIDNASNAQLYSWGGSGNWTSLGTYGVLTKGASMLFEVANNIIFGLNGQEEIDWDGSNVTHNRTAFPLGKYLRWFHNYMFVASSTSYPNRIWWSKIGDPTIWAGGITAVTVNAGGYGYAAGDVLNVTGGGGADAQLVVTTVSSGAVTAVTILVGGSGYSVTTGALTEESTSVGTGGGCTVNITSVNTTSVTNFTDINPGDGDLVMGLGITQDQLFIFKRNTIWSLTGWNGSNFSIATAAGQNTNTRIFGYGCVAPRSIVTVGDDIYFLSFMGDVPHIRSLRLTQYATTLEGGIMSYDITNTMKTINKSALDKVVGTFDGRYAYWAIPTGSSSVNNKIIVLDTLHQVVIRLRVVNINSWSTMTGKNVQNFAISTLPGYAQVYFSDSGTSGSVFKFDSSLNSDNGNPITMDVQTRAYLTDPSRKNHWKYYYFKYGLGSSSTVYVNAKTEYDASFNAQGSANLQLAPTLDNFVLDSSILGGSAIGEGRVPLINLTSKMLQIQLTETSSNPVTIYEMGTYYIPKPLRAS